MYEMFRNWETKQFWGKIVIPAPCLILKNFRNDSVLWHKTIWTENRDNQPLFYPWHLPRLLSIKFFDTRIFVKHRRVPLRRFSALWDKKSFESKSWYSLPPPPFSIKIFDTWIFLKHRKDSLRNDSALWHKTIWAENRDNQPLFYPWHFSVPEIFWNTEGFLYEFFWHCERKIFDRKLWYSLPPLPRLLSI